MLQVNTLPPWEKPPQVICYYDLKITWKISDFISLEFSE